MLRPCRGSGGTAVELRPLRPYYQQGTAAPLCAAEFGINPIHVGQGAASFGNALWYSTGDPSSIWGHAKKPHSSHQHHKKMQVREGESSHPAGDAGTLQGLLLPPLPHQQMLHAALLAVKWQRFPPSSLFRHGLPALLRAAIWHHSAQLGIISHQQHHSL